MGPRAGFAWDVFGKGNTVVRGGYGVYYPLVFYSGGSFGSEGLGFSSMTTTYTPPGGDFNFPAMQLKNGFPYSPLPPLGAAGGPDAFLGQTVPFTEGRGSCPQNPTVGLLAATSASRKLAGRRDLQRQ